MYSSTVVPAVRNNLEFVYVEIKSIIYNRHALLVETVKKFIPVHSSSLKPQNCLFVVEQKHLPGIFFVVKLAGIGCYWYY